MLTLDASIASLPGIESTRIVSKESAASEFERMFGKNLLSTLKENPLPRSIVVTMAQHSRTADDFERVASRIEGMNGVESVEYGKEWIRKMDTFFFLFVIGEIVLITLVSIAGILVISNSIGLTVVARRGEIEVMRLVGATGGFIRRPFYLEGVFQGLAAGVLAFCALYGTYLWMLSSVPDLDVYLRILGFREDEFVSGGRYLAGIIPAGLFLGLLGSYIAVRREV
jgi:cell division transport system permease protein